MASNNRRDRFTDSSSKTSTSTNDFSAIRKAYKIRRNEKGETELHRACINNEYKTAEKLLLKGHPVNEKDHGGWTCLHEACNWGHTDIARLLIEYGANIEARGMGNVTPLLDAAANGQFEIMNLLIDAGASISAVDSDGNTILDLLKTSKENSNGLCRADEDEYQRLWKLLEDRMKKGGIPLHRAARPQPSRSDASTKNQTNNRSLTNTRSGVDLYTSAISSVSRSASRKQGAVFNYESFKASRSNHRGSSTAPKKSALVSEKEYKVSDGWMIDDLNGRYIRADPCDSKKRSRGPSSRDSSPSHSDDNERSPNGNLSPPAPVNMDDCFDSEMLNDGGTNSRQSSRISGDSDSDDLLVISEKRGKKRSPKRRRLRQTRFITVDTPPPRSNINIASDGNDEPMIEEVIQPVRNVVPVQPVELQASIRPSSEIVRVNVVVDGRKFAVIVDSRYHTIEWLADKVSSNYESATGKRPVIRLYTADDAVLNASDTVEFLFYQNEQLTGKVERIDVLPMEENYRQTCQRLKHDIYDDICDLMRNAGQSTVLDFRQSSLRAAGGPSVILKSLQAEYSITVLNLRGQKLTTADATELGRAITCLQHLSNLVISCTGMHCEQILALTTEMCKEREKKYALERLDISFNAVNDSSAAHICRILARCPQLRFLNLQCIAITARFVHDHKTFLRDALSSTSITYLDLSRNHLGDAATELQTMVNDLDRYVELKLF